MPSQVLRSYAHTVFGVNPGFPSAEPPRDTDAYVADVDRLAAR